jgi:hypothetical protein
MWKPGDRIFDPMFSHLPIFVKKTRLYPKNRAGYRRWLWVSVTDRIEQSTGT